MTAQDARERAYESWREREESGWYVDDPDINFRAGWDAAKREDEQRIAALVDIVRATAHHLMFISEFREKAFKWLAEYDRERALAGIEERSSAG